MRHLQRLVCLIACLSSGALVFAISAAALQTSQQTDSASVAQIETEDCDAPLVDSSGRLDASRLEDSLKAAEAEGDLPRVRAYSTVEGMNISEVARAWVSSCFSVAGRTEPRLILFALSIEDSELSVILGEDISQLAAPLTIREQVMGPPLQNGQYEQAVESALRFVSSAREEPSNGGNDPESQDGTPSKASSGTGVSIGRNLLASVVVLLSVCLISSALILLRRWMKRRPDRAAREHPLEKEVGQLLHDVCLAGFRFSQARRHFDLLRSKPNEESPKTSDTRPVDASSGFGLQGRSVGVLDSLWMEVENLHRHANLAVTEVASMLKPPQKRRSSEPLQQGKRKAQQQVALDAAADRIEAVNLGIDRFANYVAHLRFLIRVVPIRQKLLLSDISRLLELSNNLANQNELSGESKKAANLRALLENLNGSVLGLSQGSASQVKDPLAFASDLASLASEQRNAAHRLRIISRGATAMQDWEAAVGEFVELQKKRALEISSAAIEKTSLAGEVKTEITELVDQVWPKVSNAQRLHSEASAEPAGQSETMSADLERRLLEKASSYLVIADNLLEEAASTLVEFEAFYQSSRVWRESLSQCSTDLSLFQTKQKTVSPVEVISGLAAISNPINYCWRHSGVDWLTSLARTDRLVNYGVSSKRAFEMTLMAEKALNLLVEAEPKRSSKAKSARESLDRCLLARSSSHEQLLSRQLEDSKSWRLSGQSDAKVKKSDSHKSKRGSAKTSSNRLKQLKGTIHDLTVASEIELYERQNAGCWLQDEAGYEVSHVELDNDSADEIDWVGMHGQTGRARTWSRVTRP